MKNCSVLYSLLTSPCVIVGRSLLLILCLTFFPLVVKAGITSYRVNSSYLDSGNIRITLESFGKDWPEVQFYSISEARVFGKRFSVSVEYHYFIFKGGVSHTIEVKGSKKNVMDFIHWHHSLNYNRLKDFLILKDGKRPRQLESSKN